MVRPEPASCPDWPKLEKLNREKEVIGIYLSSHPLDDFKLEINTFTTATLADLQNLRDYLDRDVSGSRYGYRYKKRDREKRKTIWFIYTSGLYRFIQIHAV